MTRTEITGVLSQARGLRRDSRLGLITVSRALGIHLEALMSWEEGCTPRDMTAAMAYVRVIRGLARHAEIRETCGYG